jgi:hypothetical protein
MRVPNRRAGYEVRKKPGYEAARSKVHCARSKAKQAGVGAGLLGGSGLVAFYGVGYLIACVLLGAQRGLWPPGLRR